MKRSHSGISTAISAPRKGPRKYPEPPTITISSRLNGEVESRTALGSMRLHQRRIERAGDTARAPSRWRRPAAYSAACRHRAMRAQRVFPQRDEGAAPGRAQQPPDGDGHGGAGRQKQIRRQAAVVDQPKWTGRAMPSMPSMPLVSQASLRNTREHQRRERQRHESEVMVLDAQARDSRAASRSTKVSSTAASERRDERHAVRAQQRAAIGADADEAALRQRHLAGVAERQVQADRGDGQHRPQREQIDAERVEHDRRDRGRADQHQRGRQAAPGGMRHHTVRSVARPSKPCGRNSTKPTSSTIGTAARIL